MHKLTNIFLAVSFILSLMVGSAEGASPSGATEVTAVIRQDCGGYPGPEPCYKSLAAWEADYGGIDFGAASVGDLVAADLIAVARIEATWTARRAQEAGVSALMKWLENWVEKEGG